MIGHPKKFLSGMMKKAALVDIIQKLHDLIPGHGAKRFTGLKGELKNSALEVA